MTVSKLLKSWAIPPVSWPIASSFWAWNSRHLRFLAGCHLDIDAALEVGIYQFERLHWP